MKTEKILELVQASLDEMKATNVVMIDVQGLTSIADFLIICSANSSRHLKAIADNLLQKVKAVFHIEMNVTGENNSGNCL